MIKLNVSVDLSGLRAKLARAKEQVPFAAALALTRTAQAVKADLQSEMRRDFTNVTPFTLGSLYITRAEKTNLVATVGIKDSALSWLRPEVYGGSRHRTLEKELALLNLPPAGMWAVPGKSAKLTSGGRVAKAWLRKIISALQTQGPANPFKRRRRNAIEYFVVAEHSRNLEAGVYGKRGTKLELLIQFAKAPRYRPRFAFHTIAERAAREHFPKEWRKAADVALASLRK